MMKELQLADGVRSAKQDGSVHRWFDLDRGADLSTSSGLGLSLAGTLFQTWCWRTGCGPLSERGSGFAD